MIQVCDLVRWNNKHWRVTSHMKRVECDYPKLHDKNDDSVDTVVDQIIIKIVQEEFEKERAKRKALGLPHARRYKLVWCKPEEATHVNLYSLCGATAPIGEVEFEGVVPWSDELIASKKDSALRLIENMHLFPHYEWE